MNRAPSAAREEGAPAAAGAGTRLTPRDHPQGTARSQGGPQRNGAVEAPWCGWRRDKGTAAPTPTGAPKHPPRAPLPGGGDEGTAGSGGEGTTGGGYTRTAGCEGTTEAGCEGTTGRRQRNSSRCLCAQRNDPCPYGPPKHPLKNTPFRRWSAAAKERPRQHPPPPAPARRERRPHKNGRCLCAQRNDAAPATEERAMFMCTKEQPALVMCSKNSRPRVYVHSSNG
jgi:hypothetical protein